MHLLQKHGMGRARSAVQLERKDRPIGGNGHRIVAHMIPQIQAGKRALADAAGACGTNGTHASRRWPIGD